MIAGNSAMDVSDLAYRLNLLESVFDANLKKASG